MSASLVRPTVGVFVGMVAVLALALWPGGVDAAFSGTNGKIAYTGGEIRHSIWSVNPDGSENSRWTASAQAL